MYDAARLHAAINDLPAALLLTAVLFDLLAAMTKRDGLRTAGFWMLVTGAVGAGLALVTGLMAEDTLGHGESAHLVMQQHETLAIVTTVLFGAIALWRIIRRGQMGPKEQPVLLTAGVIGLGLLLVTAQRGGALMFDWAGGIPTASLERALDDRGVGRDERPETPAPAVQAPTDTVDSAGLRPPGPPSHEH